MRGLHALAISLLCVPTWAQGREDAPNTAQFEPDTDTTCGMWTKTTIEWGDSTELDHPDAANPVLRLENTVAELKSTGDAQGGDVESAAELQNYLLVEYDYAPDEDSGCVGLAAVTVSYAAGATADLSGSDSTAVSVLAIRPEVKLRCEGMPAGVHPGQPVVVQAHANSGDGLELTLEGQYRGFGIQSPLAIERGTASEATASLADALVVPPRKADNVKIITRAVVIGFVQRDGGTAGVTGFGRTAFDAFTLCDTVGDCPELPDPGRTGS